MPSADLADPLEGAAVDDHQQVVVDIRVRIEPFGRDARQEVIQRGRRVGADRAGLPAVELHDPGDPERRPERVRVGILVTDDQRLPGAGDPLGDEFGNGVEIRLEAARHRVGLRLPVGR